MFEISSILAIVEPDSEAQSAAEKGAELAKLAEARLQLLMVDYSRYLEDGFYFDPLQAGKLRQQHRDAQMKALEEMAEPFRAQGVEVSTSYVWGRPCHEEIVRVVDESKPSLVIKSFQPQSKMAAMLLSNRDWELVRYCPAPLLLTKVGGWVPGSVIIAAVDPNHIHDKPAALDHKLVDMAQTLASLLAGKVHLYHSTKLPSLAGLYPLNADYRVDRERVNKLARDHALNIQQCHLSEQDITVSLPELASSLDASVVVMGVISRSRLDRVLIGSSAEKVLGKLWSDVLLVKPDSRQKLLL